METQIQYVKSVDVVRVFIGNLEQISFIVLVLPLLNLNKVNAAG